MFRVRPSSPPPAVEQRTIQLSEKQISYTLKRSSKRRSIGLRIDDRGLTVSMPLRASETWLHAVLQDKADWVVEKLESWQSRKPEPQDWHDGAALPFRGERFVLRVVRGLFASAPQLRGETLFVYVTAEAPQDEIEKQVMRWYRAEALQVFEECVAHFAPLLQVHPKLVKLSTAQTQWGSCTSHGVVRLNWRLVRMPLHLIDYVVVHELSHLIEMNHSDRFWRVVESVCPDYRQRRAELRECGISE